MKKTRRSMAMMLTMVMVIGLFSGCADKSSVNTSSQSAEANQTSREIIDMAGRSVTIPPVEDITSVFSTIPIAAIFIYMVAPDKLLNWNYDLSDIERSIIPKDYHNIPNLGMGDKINYEAVIAAGPSIAIHCNPIDDAMIADCEAFTKSLGIPVVAIDNDLEKSAEAFRLLGEIFGVEENSERLAEYAENIFSDIEKLSSISEEDKISVYFGNGADSLETAPKGSSHAQLIDRINAVNVAELDIEEGARVQISPEQLLAWNPDVIVVNGEPDDNLSGNQAAESILNNPDYASLNAVKNKRVYGIPNAPFSWVDRPMGPNRLIGMRWFSEIIYPDYISGDVDEEIKKFFDLFYHIDLSKEQLDNLLKGIQ